MTGAESIRRISVDGMRPDSEAPRSHPVPDRISDVAGRYVGLDEHCVQRLIDPLAALDALRKERVLRS